LREIENMQSIQSIANHVTKDDNEAAARNRQLTSRAEELASYAGAGYSLTHTAVIEGADYVTFVDTLTRQND
jgi:hypothetical protein